MAHYTMEERGVMRQGDAVGGGRGTYGSDDQNHVSESGLAGRLAELSAR